LEKLQRFKISRHLFRALCITAHGQRASNDWLLYQKQKPLPCHWHG